MFLLNWQFTHTVVGTLESWQLLDTTPVPDSVFFNFSTPELSVVFWDFESFAAAEISGILSGIFYKYGLGPYWWQLLDTTPAPDSVFFDWSSLEMSDIPYYPRDRELDPHVTLFAGDMGAYIG